LAAATLACETTRITLPPCRAHHPGGSNGCLCRLLPRSLEACSGFTRVARWIARPPEAAFVTRLRPVRLPVQAARQLPDQSTSLRAEPSSAGDTRLRGAPKRTQLSRFTLPTQCPRHCWIGSHAPSVASGNTRPDHSLARRHRDNAIARPRCGSESRFEAHTSADALVTDDAHTEPAACRHTR
jgi:hypothetical protein